MLSVEVGDEVTIYSGGARRGEGERATVTRKARLYFYVKRYGKEVGFSLETGQKQGQNVGAGVWARTDAQEAELLRRRTVVDYLASYGVVLNLKQGQDRTVEELESLAAVIRTWPVK